MTTQPNFVNAAISGGCDFTALSANAHAAVRHYGEKREALAAHLLPQSIDEALLTVATSAYHIGVAYRELCALVSIYEVRTEQAKSEARSRAAGHHTQVTAINAAAENDPVVVAWRTLIIELTLERDRAAALVRANDLLAQTIQTMRRSEDRRDR